MCSGDQLLGAAQHAQGQLGSGAVGQAQCAPAVKTVRPVIVVAATRIIRDQAGGTPHPVAVTLRIEADHPEIQYSGAATLTRSHPRAQLAAAHGAPLFAGPAAQAVSQINGLTVTQTLDLQATGQADGACRLTWALQDPGNPQIHVMPPHTVDLTVLTINDVTVHLEVEYRTVPRARSLGGRRTDLVRAEVWITQTQPGIGFPGTIRITRGNANLGVYRAADGSGQELFAAAGGNSFDIANGSINNGQRVVFYLHGAAAGRVTLEASLPAVGRDDVAEGPAVTVDMAVVDLELTLHRDAASPAAGPMAPADKITIGGLVAVQNPDGHRGRLRLTIARPHADLWAVGAADYEVLVSVDAAHGAIELFGHATNGAIGAGLATPLRLGQAAFAHGDVVVWIQGRATTQDWRQIKIDLGIDRPMGGLAKTPKRHGDWAMITVFDIAQLTPTVDARQYINLDTDHAHHPHRGRTFRARATLAPALANVVVAFKLVPDGGNRAGLPPAQVHQDPNVPVRGTTDAHGVATADLRLSRYGGDVFQVGAYLEEDGTAGTANPVRSARLTVWRKIFYRLYCMARTGFGDYANRIDEGGFQGELAASFVDVERVGAVQPLANDRVVLFNNFAAWAAGHMPPPGQPRTVSLGFIDSILDGPNAENVQLAGIAGGGLYQTAPSVGRMYNLANQGTWLDGGFAPRYRAAAIAQGAIQNLPIGNAAVAPHPASGGVQLTVDLTGLPRAADFELVVRCRNNATMAVGNQTWREAGAANIVHQRVINGYAFDSNNWFVSLQVRTVAVPATAWQPLPLGNIALAPHWDDFRLSLSFHAMAADRTYEAELRLISYNSQNFKGVQHGVATAVALREVERVMGGQENATARQITQHEVGHYLGLGSRYLIDGTLNANYYDHPGVGPHCNHGPDTCVMRHDLTNPPNTQFCPVCRVLLRARDMSNPNVSTTVAFPG